MADETQGGQSGPPDLTDIEDFTLGTFGGIVGILQGAGIVGRPANAYPGYYYDTRRTGTQAPGAPMNWTPILIVGGLIVLAIFALK